MVEINDSNWLNYKDGWAIYTDVKSDATRMGIDLLNSEHFRIYENSNF